MKPVIFIYSFTINGYDVTITIEFFPYIIVLEDFSPELTDDESESVDVSLDLWNSEQQKFTLFCIILLLGRFLQKYSTAGPFSAGIFHR